MNEDIERALNGSDADLRAFAEDLTFNETERDAVEDRLALIRRLISKYGATTGEVLAYADACRPGNPRDCTVAQIAKLYKGLM